MRSRSGSFGLSFLDLLSCALGASVILSIIFSLIKDPPSAPFLDEFIFAVVTTQGNHRAGIQVRDPDGVTTCLFPQSPDVSVAGVHCWEAKLARHRGAAAFYSH